MRCNRWIGFCSWITVAGVTSGVAYAEGPTPQRPHVIVVLADDLGPGDLGFAGGKIASTPNLDRLAAEGLRFTQYTSAAPICSPSRCGLLTGRFPAELGITSYLQTKAGNRACGQRDFLDPAAPTLPRILKAAGYATMHVGKWHLGGGRDVVDAPKFAAYGYDRSVGTYESPEPHPDITAANWIWSPKDKVKRWERSGFFVDAGLDFLARHGDGPCFVNLWLDDPHTPWKPSADASGGDSEENLRQVLVENDRQIGRLLAALKERKLEDRTLVLFTSDNGPLPTFKGRRSAGLRGSKLSLYEGGLRLPCVVRLPGRVPAGKVDSETLLSGVDLLPTICGFVGAPLPEGFAESASGEDLSAAFGGTPQMRKRPLLWEYSRNETAFKHPPGRDRSPPLAIREGEWKLLLDPASGQRELYSLSADPNERREIAASHPEVVARLEAALLAWKKRWPESP